MITINEVLPVNKCAFCRKNMQTMTIKKPSKNFYEGLCEIEIKNKHSKCYKLENKQKQLAEKLLNVEFVIFCQKFRNHSF